MNLSAVIVGVFAALVAPVVIGVATAAGAVLSLMQGIAPATKIARKFSNSKDIHSSNPKVVKMSERRRSVEEFRSAA